MTETGFDSLTISKAIHTKWAGNTVHFVVETDSTNLLAKRLAEKGAAHGTLAVTEFQTAGRGRFERSWQAPAGSSVMMTLLLRPGFAPENASMLTLVMGLSVAQAVESLGFAPQIKWPNDVVLSRKKICGILTEMSVGEQGIRHVVIGVGINVNIEELPKELQDKGTSLYLEAGHPFDRNQVVAIVMERFEKNYETFEKTCNLSGLKEAYEKLLSNLGSPVRVLEKDNPYEGVALGIDRRGELLVCREDGHVTAVNSGEVSVRGLYQYV